MRSVVFAVFVVFCAAAVVAQSPAPAGSPLPVQPGTSTNIVDDVVNGAKNLKNQAASVLTRAGGAVKYAFDYVAKNFQACTDGNEKGFCVAQCGDEAVIEIGPGTGKGCAQGKVCCDFSQKSQEADADDDYSDDEASAPAPVEAGATGGDCDLSAYDSPFDCGNRYASGRNLGATRCIKLKPGQNTRKSDVSVATSLMCPLLKLIKAAKDAGIANFNLNSGFRTNAEQQALRNRNCRNGKCSPKTAPAGYSNHQNGIALDIEVASNPALYTWLSNNAAKHGFIRAVNTEKWHWEYRPGSKCNAIVKYTCRN